MIETHTRGYAWILINFSSSFFGGLDFESRRNYATSSILMMEKKLTDSIGCSVCIIPIMMMMCVARFELNSTDFRHMEFLDDFFLFFIMFCVEQFSFFSSLVPCMFQPSAAARHNKFTINNISERKTERKRKT